MASIHATAEGLHASGVMDKRTTLSSALDVDLAALVGWETANRRPVNAAAIVLLCGRTAATWNTIHAGARTSGEPAG
jgi:hypothetical protein